MIIIGQGRVGSGLSRRAERKRVPHQVVTREAGWNLIEGGGHGPILVCTNAGDLTTVVENTPTGRREDLVFVQNGMLDSALGKLDCGDNTRGLLYFAASGRGAEIDPGGDSIFTGQHAMSVANWFHAIALGAKKVTRAEFSNEMASKLIWNCTFGLLCDVRGVSVGMLVEESREEVDALVAELCAVSNAAIGTTLQSETVSADLCSYSLSIASYCGSLKQWEWRNGWFVAASRTYGVPTPIHDRLLDGRTPA
jgi:ketopantoate reductase